VYLWTERKLSHDLGLARCKHGEAGAAGFGAETRRAEGREQGEVSRLRGHEIAVEPAQRGVGEVLGKESEALAGAGFDQRGHEQSIEQWGNAGLPIAPRRRRQPRDVAVRSREAERGIVARELIVDLREMIGFFARERSERFDQRWRFAAVPSEQAQRALSRLELTVRVIRQQRRKILGGDFGPDSVGGRQQGKHAGKAVNDAGAAAMRKGKGGLRNAPCVRRLFGATEEPAASDTTRRADAQATLVLGTFADSQRRRWEGAMGWNLAAGVYSAAP